MSEYQTIVMLLVGVAFPLYALKYGGQTRRLVTAHPEKRIYVYRFTIIQLIILAALAVSTLLLADIPISQIGLGFVGKPEYLIGLPILACGMLWLMHLQPMTAKGARQFKRNHSKVMFLFPTNYTEYKYMVAVSFVAGICEEIIFRGFMIWFLSEYVSVIPAVVLSSIPFALAHLTSTGWRNTMGVFGLALVFATVYVLTGSLWLPILLHTLVDLYAATRAYKAAVVDRSLETENTD